MENDKQNATDLLGSFDPGFKARVAKLPHFWVLAAEPNGPEYLIELVQEFCGILVIPNCKYDDATKYFYECNEPAARSWSELMVQTQLRVLHVDSDVITSLSAIGSDRFSCDMRASALDAEEFTILSKIKWYFSAYHERSVYLFVFNEKQQAVNLISHLHDRHAKICQYTENGNAVNFLFE